MGAFFATLAAAIPNVLLSILSRIFTESMMQIVAEKVITHGLKKAVALTTNTIDDEIAAEVIKRLQSGGGDG
jgi:hypothetical protein